MSLSGDKRTLERQKEKIDDQEDVIGGFNRRIDALIEEIRDSIVSTNVENLVGAVEELRDTRGANGSDSNLSSARVRIQSEISTIQAAINAQKRAAAAMRAAADKT